MKHTCSVGPCCEQSHQLTKGQFASQPVLILASGVISSFLTNSYVNEVER